MKLIVTALVACSLCGLAAGCNSKGDAVEATGSGYGAPNSQPTGENQAPQGAQHQPAAQNSGAPSDNPIHSGGAQPGQ